MFSTSYTFVCAPSFRSKLASGRKFWGCFICSDTCIELLNNSMHANAWTMIPLGLVLWTMSSNLIEVTLWQYCNASFIAVKKQVVVVILHSSLSWSRQNICTIIESSSGPENNPQIAWMLGMLYALRDDYLVGWDAWSISYTHIYIYVYIYIYCIFIFISIQSIHLYLYIIERGRESEHRVVVITPISCYPFESAQPQEHLSSLEVKGFNYWLH